MIIKQYIFESYLAMVKNSVGSKMFKNFYAEYDGLKKDGLNNGELSCAFFVSSVLTIWGSIDKPHATVTGVKEALGNAGWQLVDKPEMGDVLVWEAASFTGSKETNEHIGFYIGDNKAISTNYKTGEVLEHDWLFKDSRRRKVIAIYQGKHLLPDRVKEIS
jgi:hypothetical protein